MLQLTPLIAMAVIACWHHAKLRFDQNDYRPVTLCSQSLKTDSNAAERAHVGNLAPAPALTAPQTGAGVSFSHRFHAATANTREA